MIIQDLKLKSTEMHVKVPVKSLTTYTEKDSLMFKGFIDAVFEHDDGIFLIDYKTDKNTNYASHHKRQLAVYKKIYSQLENIPEEKIQTCLIFVALRGGSTQENLILLLIMAKEMFMEHLKNIFKKFLNGRRIQMSS